MLQSWHAQSITSGIQIHVLIAREHMHHHKIVGLLAPEPRPQECFTCMYIGCAKAAQLPPLTLIGFMNPNGK